MQCVQVCPTGIDIREGPQIGCITCALCIDACDKVMDQIGRPRGLIDYATELDSEKEMRGETPTPVLKALFRPRTIIYFTLWAAIGLAMLLALGARTRIDIAADADRNPQYVRLSDGSIRNAYLIKIRNMESRPRTMTVTLEGLPGALMWAEGMNRDQAARSVRIDVPADQVRKERIMVVAPAQGAAREDFTFTLRAVDKPEDSAQDSDSFVRPEEGQ